MPITNPPGQPAFGTAEHARLVTYGRHTGVQSALAWLAFSHLPPALQSLSQPLYEVAIGLLRRIPHDSAELTTALNTLVEAKDWFMRAGIRSDQGVPGPVPRPAAVVDPPSRAETAQEVRFPALSPETAHQLRTALADGELLDVPEISNTRGGMGAPADDAVSRRAVMPTVDGIRGHQVSTPEEDEIRRTLALDAPTDWPKIARDLTSGDDALIAEHLPSFGRPIQDRPQA